MRRTLVSLGLTAAAASAALAQTPATGLAKPPANAHHFVIESTGGKHGDSWRWIPANGNRMGRESMNLRGQVFEVDSEGKAGADGMPWAVAIRGVTPSGDAAGSFSILPLAVNKREAPRDVSIDHRCTPGRGWGIAQMTRRLSGSQLNATGSSGRSEAGGRTVYGADDLSIGNTQNSGCWFTAIHAPTLEPSGETWIVGRVRPFRTDQPGYGIGDDPGGDDVNSVSLFSSSSGFRKKASILPSGDNEAETTSSITMSGAPPTAETDHSP